MCRCPAAFQEMKEMYNIHEFLSVKRNFGDNQVGLYKLNSVDP